MRWGLGAGVVGRTAANPKNLSKFLRFSSELREKAPDESGGAREWYNGVNLIAQWRPVQAILWLLGLSDPISILDY